MNANGISLNNDKGKIQYRRGRVEHPCDDH